MKDAETKTPTKASLRCGAGYGISCGDYSDVFALQFLTSSGWQTDRELSSESLAIAHFFAVGKANVWKGHVRVIQGERIVKSTLPNAAMSDYAGGKLNS